MHELQVMHQIVQMVQNICQKEKNGKPHLVRIQVSSYSHLATHTPQELETTFRLATQGTTLQHLKLDMITIPTKTLCHSCNKTLVEEGETYLCPFCGSGNLERENVPEVIVKEVEWAEDGP